MGEQQSTLSPPRAAAAAAPLSPAGGPREPGPDEPPPPRDAAPGGETARPGRSGEPPPAASPERRGAGEEGAEVAAGSEQPPAAGEPAALVEEGPGPGPEGSNGRRRPARRHVYCTVYCVENDRPAEAPVSPRGGGPGAGPPPARRGLAAGSDPLEVGGSIEVVDLYLLPEPFSGLIAGEFGPLLVLSCRVCLEEKPIKPLSCCKKAVCEECLKRYLSSQVRPSGRCRVALRRGGERLDALSATLSAQAHRGAAGCRLRNRSGAGSAAGEAPAKRRGAAQERSPSRPDRAGQPPACELRI